MTYEKDKNDIPLTLMSRQTSSCSHKSEIPRSVEFSQLCSAPDTVFVHWWHLNVLPIFIRHAKIHASFWKSKKICITRNKLAITNYFVWNKIPIFEAWLIAWSLDLNSWIMRQISTLTKCDLVLSVEILGMSNNSFFDYKFLKQ